MIRRGPVKLNGKPHSIERDHQAVIYHYDISNDFYNLWLDPDMVYSCGYFLNADDTIEKAQSEKLDYICRKLRLRPGQRLLDIGCGWGGLVICAAVNYAEERIFVRAPEECFEEIIEKFRWIFLADQSTVFSDGS